MGLYNNHKTHTPGKGRRQSLPSPCSACQGTTFPGLRTLQPPAGVHTWEVLMENWKTEFPRGQSIAPSPLHPVASPPRLQLRPAGFQPLQDSLHLSLQP